MPLKSTFFTFQKECLMSDDVNRISAGVLRASCATGKASLALNYSETFLASPTFDHARVTLTPLQNSSFINLDNSQSILKLVLNNRSENDANSVGNIICHYFLFQRFQLS